MNPGSIGGSVDMQKGVIGKLRIRQDAAGSTYDQYPIEREDEEQN